MSVVTFYSFKGGVGRTQAVANVAFELCSRGRRVLIVDMDLESPGVLAYFGQRDADASGLLEYLEAWRSGDKPPEIDDFLVEVHRGRGNIRVLGPGRTDAGYSRRLAAFSWTRFYEEEEGDVVMERLREELVRRADVVLIDSRTGMTDIGTICTFQLPDVVVALFAMHEQGLGGTALLAGALARRMSEEGSRLRRVALVPARVEEADGARYTEWIGRVRAAFAGLPAAIGLVEGPGGDPLRIPYDRDVAYGEHIVMESAREGRLAASYRVLAGVVEGDESQALDTDAEIRSLWREGRREEALARARAAVTRGRELVKGGDVSARSALAHDLRRLASLLDQSGRYTESVAHGREAVALLRVGGKPAELAFALSDLAASLGWSGRLDEAAATSREAVGHLRVAVLDDPSLRPRLATSLSNLSVDLSNLGRENEATAVAREAAEICRVLAVENPFVYRYQLATSLNNLTVCLGRSGKSAEALDVIDETIRLYRVVTAQAPLGNPELGRALNNRAQCLADLGRETEALAASREAVDQVRIVAAADPAYRALLASSLATLTSRLRHQNLGAEAIATAEEAIPVFRELARDEPAAHGPELARSLMELGGALLAVHGPEERGLAAYQEAYETWRRLAKDEPEAFAVPLGGSGIAVAWAYVLLNRAGDALPPAKDALATIRPLFVRDPIAHADLARNACTAYLAVCSVLSIQPDESLIAGLPHP
jgi:MinD-like ATPase involved in chromosome partitioning or flagellar assembly